VNQRLPGLDALRVGLILLGIPYHAALPFASDALGLIRADRTSSAVAALVVVLLLLPTGWSAETQFLAVTGLTLVATWASCVVVSRSRMLSILMNGRPLPPLPSWTPGISAGIDGIRHAPRRYGGLRHSLPVE
jgi:hypothetical protein